MKKIFVEIFLAALIVLIPSALIYKQLAPISSFWNAQLLWSIGLILCWIAVAGGYYHQGWLVRSRKNADSVSMLLPTAVFLVQCILFIKGIYYHDWALIAGALLVNSGVIFALYQVVKVRK